MITKARLTEDGNFQVDKEIIEYPEILSAGRNLFIKNRLQTGQVYSIHGGDLVTVGTHVYGVLEHIPFISKRITISAYGVHGVSLIFWDEELNFISSTVGVATYISNQTVILNAPDETNYITYNINGVSNNNLDDVQVKLEKGNKATDSTPAPEDLGLSYPSSIQNFVPSIHDDFILMPEIIESSISDKLQISPTQLKIPNLLIEQSIVPKYAASENLILHYDFKGKRNVDSDRGIVWDHSGNNNNGQLYNFVYNQTTGYDGIGLTFAGNQYIKFDNIIQPETEEVTIDILINITSDATSGGASTLFCCRNKSGIGIAIFSFNNGIIRIDTGNATGNQWSSTYSIQYNTPTKITITRDSNKRSLYINNQFHSSNNDPGNFSGIGSVTSMGASQVNDTGYGNFLNGIIYSAKIYNRALTPEEITHNFQIDKLRFNINN